MRTLKDFWFAQAEWSQAVFGSDFLKGPEGALKHLKLEADECLENPTDYMEYVDCLFLVFDAARRAGISYNKMVALAFEKLEINRNRIWNTPEEGKPCEHKEENETVQIMS